MNKAEKSYIAGGVILAAYVLISTLTDFSLGEWLQHFDFP